MDNKPTYLWDGVPAGVPCWHIHHDKLLEWSTVPLAARAAYIRNFKPPSEHALRLRLMRPTRGELPVEVVEARRARERAWRARERAWRAYGEAVRAYDEARRARDEAWRARERAWRAYGEAVRAYDEARRARDEAWRAYDEARRACGEAERAYDEALAGHTAEIEALHAQECPDCPWDGETIFA